MQSDRNGIYSVSGSFLTHHLASQQLPGLFVSHERDMNRRVSGMRVGSRTALDYILYSIETGGTSFIETESGSGYFKIKYLKNRTTHNAG
jgi:hypothetical protein